MRDVKTVHPERLRNFNRYKRPILASLISAVLIISIIYMGSFLPTAQSGSGSSSNFFEIYIRNATLTEVTMKGPYTYNSLNVTVVTVDVADLSEMLLIKEEEGSRLELEVPRASATKLMIYTVYLKSTIPVDGSIPMETYGNVTLDFSFRELHLIYVYMKAVYQQAESFSTSRLSLTCT